MDEPLLRKVDAVTVPVPDLDRGIEVYCDRLGHELAWRNDAIGQAGLRLPDADTELVLTTTHGAEPNWLVRSADDAAEAFVAAGGRILAAATDIPVGRLAVVADPFDNVLVLLDLSKGRYTTDASGAVTGVAPAGRPRHAVRPAVVDDAEAFGAIHVAAWQAAYRGIMTDEYLDGIDPGERAAVWRDQIGSGDPVRHVRVATADGEVVGFVAFGPAHDDPTVGQVYALNVHPAAWRAGHGRRLLRTATDELTRAEFDEAVLFVAAANTRARRLYDEEGWAPDGHEVTEDVLGATVHEARYRRRLRD